MVFVCLWLCMLVTPLSTWTTTIQPLLTCTHAAVATACCHMLPYVLQLLLGQDGADMAEEVLPAQLLKRVDAAWAKHCSLQQLEHAVLQ
jgi:hypothetical protein